MDEAHTLGTLYLRPALHEQLKVLPKIIKATPLLKRPVVLDLVLDDVVVEVVVVFAQLDGVILKLQLIHKNLKLRRNLQPLNGLLIVNFLLNVTQIIGENCFWWFFG